MNLSCEPCKLAKHYCSFYVSRNNKNTIPFGIVHCDVWGPTPMTFLHGFCYFVTFVDNFSRTTWVYLLKKKSEVFPVIETFHKMVETFFFFDE